MTQPLSEALVETTRETAGVDDWERDQVAWNLPRDRVSEPTPTDPELDWAGFSQAFFPESRRHDLRAIAAYAAYKRARRRG